MNRPRIGEKHQFRLAMCGHKAAEVAMVCVLLMVQGDLAGATLAHLVVASKTGILGVSPIVGVTFTRYAAVLTNRLGKRIDRLAEPFSSTRSGEAGSQPLAT